MSRQRRYLFALAATMLLGAPSAVVSFSASSSMPVTKVNIPAASAAAPTRSTKNDSVLHQYQTKVAAPLASSFEPSSFHPFPPLSNQHLQTVVATFLRHIPEVNYFYSLGDTIQGLVKAKATSKTHLQFWNDRQRIDTPDGDFFHVDSKLHSSCVDDDSKGMVIMCHGLESNSDSNLSRDMAQAYYNAGLDVACLNFRGCCGNTNDLLGGYHLGFTDDVKHYLKVLKNTSLTSKPIYLSGFSLGANVVLKALGELGMDAVEEYNIQGATAFCVPYNAERNAPFLGQAGFNQIVYCGNLLKTLRKRAQFQLDLHCDGDENTDKFDYAGVMAAKTITDFDEAFVARIYGFESAIDYYRKTSCIGFLENIAVPTFILTARDDPFMDPSLLPIELTQEGGGRAPIKMVGTKHGGHCGYIFHKVDSRDDMLETSWSSTEMARFLQHVHKRRQKEESEN